VHTYYTHAIPTTEQHSTLHQLLLHAKHIQSISAHALQLFKQSSASKHECQQTCVQQLPTTKQQKSTPKASKQAWEKIESHVPNNQRLTSGIAALSLARRHSPSSACQNGPHEPAKLP
jgi:hypothetical protein